MRNWKFWGWTADGSLTDMSQIGQNPPFRAHSQSLKLPFGSCRAKHTPNIPCNTQRRYHCGTRSVVGTNGIAVTEFLSHHAEHWLGQGD